MGEGKEVEERIGEREREREVEKEGEGEEEEEGEEGSSSSHSVWWTVLTQLHTTRRLLDTPHTSIHPPLPNSALASD